MKYFEPLLTLGALLPPQTHLQDKFGGLPWGLPQEQWPICANCGNPMTHIAQLTHHNERLDLGATGRVLFIFFCYYSFMEGCATSKADSGANAVLILEQSQLTEGLTQPPTPEATTEEVAIEVEARVKEWRPKEDPVSQEEYLLFFDEETHRNIPYEVRDEVDRGTKLGGAPFWWQSASRGPRAPYYFVAQLDSSYVFKEPPTKKKVPKDLESDMIISPKGWWVYQTSLFAGSGTGYLFVDSDAQAPSGKFIWQK